MKETTARKWWILGALAMGLVLVLGLFGCAGSKSNVKTVKEGQLTVAASLDFPPFENLPEGSDEAEGFSVDMMKAIGEEMNLEVVYLPTQNFDTIIPTLQNGNTADVGVSSFTITEDRKDLVDFTDSYMVSNQGIVVMKGSSITADNYATELADKVIYVQSGTTGEEYARENFPNADIRPLAEVTAMFMALQSGQGDAIINDLPVDNYYVAHGYSDAEVIAEIPTGEFYAIAVSKDNPDLTKELNKALQTLKDNGTYAKIYKEWFGVEPTEAEMNATSVN